MDQWLKVWSLRNDQRHGKDIEAQNQMRLQSLTSELTELYSYKTKVCPNDRSIFYESVEQHLAKQKSLDHIETWISIHTAAIKASAHQATTLGLTRNRTLLDFSAFNPIPGQAPSPSGSAFRAFFQCRTPGPGWRLTPPVG